jgi:hypothetical protein
MKEFELNEPEKAMHFYIKQWYEEKYTLIDTSGIHFNRKQKIPTTKTSKRT